MSGKEFYENLHNLQQQIEELASIDSGLAQGCHCSEPCHCDDEKKYWMEEREWLANNIRKALML